MRKNWLVYLITFFILLAFTAVLYAEDAEVSVPAPAAPAEKSDNSGDVKEASPKTTEKAKKSSKKSKKSAKKSESKSSDKGAAAVVNGAVITEKSVELEFNLFTKQLAQMGRPVDSSRYGELKKSILENLISAELLYQESQKKGIKVDNALVAQQVNMMKGQFHTEDEYKNALSQVGLNEELVTAQIKKGLSIKGLIDQQYTDKIVISDKELKDYYDKNPEMFKRPEQVKASHILLKTDPTMTEKQKTELHKKLEDIRAKAVKGEDFATLAKVSDDPGSNTKGGDLGYFSRGQMDKVFEDTAFALKSGEVSNVIETRFGYHIIKSTDKRPESTLPFAEVKDKLKQQLLRQKVQTEVGILVEKLKEKAKIERFSI